MHTIELVQQALDVAELLGYTIRQDWLDGGGGECELKGKKYFFLDLALTPLEQLDQVLDVLRGDPRAASLPMAPELRQFFRRRKSA
jgi:hypothetical protein